MNQLIIIGFDEIVSNKYIDIIEKAIKDKQISSYSIIDLEDSKNEIKNRISKIYIKPANEIYLKANKRNVGIEQIEDAFKTIQEKSQDKIKVYIATELRSHLFYLTYCLEKGYDCLIEKPIFAPLKKGVFYPQKISHTMKKICNMAQKKDIKTSVMTLGRYHPIYNEILIENIKKRVIKYSTPVTSINMRVNGGVWNLHKEYLEREDHPYKYGYGMLMHGAYHYLDIFIQLVELNKLIYPNDHMIMAVKTYAAYPFDQNDRISKKISEKFDDYDKNFKKKNKNVKFGETDFVVAFELKNETKKSVITLGTLSFEQTTPSIRFWKDFPVGVYNKNGRISSVDVEAKLSVLYSMHVSCFDVPEKINNNIEKIGAKAVVTTRSNFNLLKDEEPITEKEYNGLFHNISNKKVMENWIYDKESKSRLSMHKNVMNLISCIALSLKMNGKEIKSDLL